MKQDDFSELTNLWQSAPPTKNLNLVALQRRYQRLRWLKRLNIIAEIIVLVGASILTLWLIFSSDALQTAIYAAVMTIWGWMLFIPISISRWRTFNMMKSESLAQSIKLHLALIDQEQFRWKLSFVATFALAVIFTFSLLTQRAAWLPFGDHNDWWIVALLVALSGGFLRMYLAGNTRRKALEG